MMAFKRKPKPAVDRNFMPGDILAFAGCGWESRMIALWTTSLRQKLTGQMISHVGICARHIDTARDTRRILHFESTTLRDLPCLIAGHKVRGVQANDPWERIDGYDGKVWRLRPARPLLTKPSKDLSKFLTENLGRPYDTFSAMVAGTFYIKKLFDHDAEAFFCDELVAMALFEAGHIPQTFNASSVTPAWLCRELVRVGLYRKPERLK